MRGQGRVVTRWLRANDGGVAIIIAAAFPLLIGVVSLAVEFGSALLQRSENQRIVDTLTYTAAFAYVAARSDPEAVALDAARNLGVLNQVMPEQVSLAVTGDELTVNLSADRVLLLSRLISSEERLTVVTSAVAKIGKSPGFACVLALDSITSGGNSGYTLNGCTIGANESLDVTGNRVNSNCTSPAEAAVSTRGCNSWSASPPFTDPFNISWDEAKILCNAAGNGDETELVQNQVLRPGPHCISGSYRFAGNTRISSQNNAGVTLFFSQNSSLTLTGNAKLDLVPSDILDLTPIGRAAESPEGLLMYGPQADFSSGGGADLKGIGCFGMLMRTISISGNSSIEGTCPEGIISGGGGPKPTFRLIR